MAQDSPYIYIFFFFAGDNFLPSPNSLFSLPIDNPSFNLTCSAREESGNERSEEKKMLGPPSFCLLSTQSSHAPIFPSLGERQIAHFRPAPAGAISSLIEDRPITFYGFPDYGTSDKETDTKKESENRVSH